MWRSGNGQALLTRIISGSYERQRPPARPCKGCYRGSARLVLDGRLPQKPKLQLVCPNVRDYVGSPIGAGA